jgi:hypothetical protein
MCGPCGFLGFEKFIPLSLKKGSQNDDRAPNTPNSHEKRRKTDQNT